MDDSDHRPNTLTWKRTPPASRAKAVDCAISDQCQTCTYINTDYKQSLATKNEAGLSLLRDQGLLEGATVLPANPSKRDLRYRTHAKLAVRRHPDPSAGRFAIGLFKKGTHEIVDLVDCPLHKKAMNLLIADLKELLEESMLEPYDESSNSGDLRYVTVRTSHVTNALMLTFVVTRKLNSELKTIVKQLKAREHKIYSAHLNLHTEQSNAIFSDESTLIAGSLRLRETLCDLTYEISPTSFFQVNPWVAGSIYQRIEKLVGERSGQPIAWDLYSGIGQISLILARQGYKTLGIEMNPQATRDAQANAVINDLQQHVHFIAGRVEEVQGAIPDWAWPPSLIVANPSRKGISEDMLAFIVRALKKSPQGRLIYMSCEIKTLTRDLAILGEDGYRLRQIESFDMFPYTDKMEWLSVIERV